MKHRLMRTTLQVELPKIGERVPDSDDEVKDFLTAKKADPEPTIPSEDTFAADDVFDAVIDAFVSLHVLLYRIEDRS